MGRFNKGVFLGGILGLGLAWMTLTPNGRKTRDAVVDNATRVYEEVKKRLMESGAWEHVTKQKYIAMVREVVDKYAIQTGLAEKTKDILVKVVGSQWHRMQKEVKKRV